jgi:hypothetical protein
MRESEWQASAKTLTYTWRSDSQLGLGRIYFLTFRKNENFYERSQSFREILCFFAKQKVNFAKKRKRKLSSQPYSQQI